MIRNYLLTAWKVFMRRKLFTAINLLCIVLTLVVLMVVTALLEHAFFPSGVEGRSDRFLQVGVMASRSDDGHRQRNSPLGYKVIEKYLRPLKSARLVGAVSGTEAVSVYQTGRVSELQLRHTDANYWKILDFKVLAGRVPSEEDVVQGRFVAVLNASSARLLFPGALATALGQKMVAGGQQFEVIGVVEDAMQLNAFADIWVPVTTLPSTEYRSQMSGDFFALLLADSPAGLDAIRREVEAVARTVQFDDPKNWNRAYFWGDSKADLFARMLFDRLEKADSGAATLLAIIVTLMLLFMLLPALNLVNLNIGRIMERSSEIGVRKAFGATSTQLVGQLVVENVLLCLVGGLVGLACAQLALLWLEGSGLIPYLKISLNFAVFGYGLLLSLVFGLLSGVIPAWKMSRLDPVFALKGNA
ncbi:MAG: ABC transporter permease [Pseudomonadota bacterium]